MSEYQYISDDDTFRSAVRAIESQDEPLVAVDIEAELNLHVYGERFCLLQMYDGRHAAVVDPVDVSPEAIKEFLENPDIKKIVYDAASDRTLLYKTHRILMSGLVDLKPAVELLEMEKQGLDSVLEAVLGIEPPASKKKFQQHNWTRRPIAEPALDYALRDVLFLFDLKERLFSRLADADKLGDWEVENEKRQSEVPDINRKPGVMRSRRFSRLSNRRQRAFERYYDIREGYAERLDVPPNNVIANNDLFSLAADKLAVDDVKPNRRIPYQVFESLRSELAAAVSEFPDE